MFKKFKSSVIFHRGMELARAGQNEAAIEEYNVAIRLNPKNAKAYCGRATAKSDLGLRAEAMADYDEAVRLSPYDFHFWALRGMEKVSCGHYESAIADYNYAIRLNPEFPTTYCKRAFAKAALGNRDAAIADYNAAIRLNPDDEEAKGGLNYIKTRGIHDLVMLEIFRKDPSADVTFFPERAQDYVRRGRALSHHNFHTLANLDFDQAIRLNRDLPDAYVMRAEAKRALGQLPEAIEDCDAAINLNPDENIALACYMTRSLVYSKMQHWDAALEDLERVRTVAEKTGDTNTLQKTDEFTTATKQMRDALNGEIETTD